MSWNSTWNENLEKVFQNSEKVLSSHAQAEESNRGEMQKRCKKKNRSSSNSSCGSHNFNSECSETIFSICSLGEESNLTETDLSRKDETGNSSNSSIKTQNSDSVCSRERLNDHETSKVSQEVNKRKNRSSINSNKETESLKVDCLETARISHAQAEEINWRLIRSRNRNTSLSDSSVEILDLDSECSETPHYSHEKVETRSRKRNRSSCDSSVEFLQEVNFDSECSETAAFSHEKAEQNQRQKNRSPSGSSREAHNLDSECSETASFSNIKEYTRSRMRNRSSSDSSIEILQEVNFDTECSETAAFSQPFEDCNNGHHLQMHKEKNQFNLTESQKSENKNSVFPTSRRTRDSSNLYQNKSSSSELPEKLSDHYQTPKLNIMHQSTDYNNKRSRDYEQSQDIYSDSNLSVRKKAKNSFTLYTTSQNTDSEFSENRNKHFHTQKLHSVSNLPSEAGSRIPINLSRNVQCSDISKKQNQPMQADEDLCMRESECTSDLNDKVMEPTLEFSKQNFIDILDEHEEQENVLSSDLHVAKTLKTYRRSKSKVNISDSENSCVEDYPSENKQTFSTTSFNLNGKSSNNLGKDYSEAELDKYMSYTGQEDEAMNKSTSQNGTETLTYLGKENNLSDSEVLSCFDDENNMEELNGLLRKPRMCPTENGVCLQNATAQERDEEDGSFESGLSETENAQEKFEKHEEMPESLRDCETYAQSSNSRASSIDSNSSFKPLEQEEEVTEEDSDFSDMALIEKYGIKKCTVVLDRIKPLKVHYGTKFFEELAKNAYMYRKNNVVDLARVYKKAKISQFSALSQETFEHKILKCINSIHQRKKLERKRTEMVVAEEKRLEEEKQRREEEKLTLERKIFYDKNNFVIVKEEDTERIRQALRNRNNVFVAIERNEQAYLLGREFLKSQGIVVEHHKIDRENSCTSDCDPPSLGRESPSITEIFDDASENKSTGDSK